PALPTAPVVASVVANTPSHPNPVTISRPVLRDVAPTFDPDGNHLYFLSFREFNPVYDGLHFDLGFPWGMRPYVITLRADLPNPFIPHPELDEDEDRRKEEKEPAATNGNGNGKPKDDPAPPPADPPAEPPADPPAEPPAADPPAPDDPPAEDPPANPPAAEPSPDEADEDAADGAGSGGAAAMVVVGASARLRRGEYPAPRIYAMFGPPAAPEQPEALIPAPKPASTGQATNGSAEAPPPSPKPRRGLRIDLDGIAQRILPFPVPDGRYGQIRAISGKVLFTNFDVVGTLDNRDWDDDDTQLGTLRAWSFKDFKSEVLVDRVGWFDLSRDRKKLIYGSGRRLRVISAGDKPNSDSGHSRRTGWVDLSRIKVSVDPLAEWQQMFREAWRLQRDHFWSEDMNSVDWHAVFDRYFPLIARVSTRLEFSDLIREMQGELGTSHTYEVGGDYRPAPYYGLGFLGATLAWDAQRGGYRVAAIAPGDPWVRDAHSPLAATGIDVKVGDLLVGVNGQRVDAATSPAQLLVHQAGQEVLLTFAELPESAAPALSTTPAVPATSAATETDVTVQAPEGAPAPDDAAASDQQLRSVVVRTLRSETLAYYRTWVEQNRNRVHELSKGRVGYVHIPDMGPSGYAEFLRGYLAETDRDAMVVDVRYNGGGHVSQLILEKLARRRIGFESSRWGGVNPYPSDSIAGPQVALTNEYAGSDGDIFCHSFKLLKLGPLVGKRTWGGVVGINPRHPLVDGTVTTQPEYGFWFEDVGWNVENYGTDPDIEVDYTPQDYAAGRDPQLERAVAEALRLLELQPVLRPDFATRPSLAQPKLPPRSVWSGKATEVGPAAAASGASGEGPQPLA
ncbi:MAG: S41 family peptidase, partial [Caldilineaceae bacterium]